MSLETDILDLLTTDGVIGGVTGWTGQVAVQPETPDQVVTVTATPGGPPDQSSGTKYDEPDFQVRIRGGVRDLQATNTKIREIFDTLNNATLVDYVFVFPQTSEPLFLGEDTNRRPQYSLNFNVMRKRP